MVLQTLLELSSKFQVLSLFSVNIVLTQFYELLNLKWQLDYMITKDNLCKNYRWTKFEVESLRYSLLQFFYGDDKTFEKLRQNNVTVYSVFVTYFVLILILLIIALIFYPILAFGIALVIFMIFFIIIVVINSLFMKSYDDIYNYIYLEDSDIFKYYAVYKILSAVIIISNLKDEKLEFTYEKLNDAELTFDDVLERNIASYENISQSSKVVSIKQDAYKKLDFLKYIVFDKTSPYYLKYFDNVYARLPNADNHYFLSELKKDAPSKEKKLDTEIKCFYTRLNDYYNSKNDDKSLIQFIKDAYNKPTKTADTLQTDILKKFDDNNKQGGLEIYSGLKNIITDINTFLASLKNDSSNTQDTLDPEIKCFYNKLNDYYNNKDGDKSLIQFIKDAYNKPTKTADTLKKDILEKFDDNNKQGGLESYTDLKNIIRDIKNYFANTDKFSILNSLISDIFNNYDIDINVPQNDYITFYLDNKDVLTDDTKTQDIVNKLKYQANFIYSYFVFLTIVFFLISHLMYMSYNSTIYVYVLLSILSIYILFIWMYTHQTFVDY